MRVDRLLSRPETWLVYQAAIAMYRAKATGRHHVFGPQEPADTETTRAADDEVHATPRRGVSFRRPQVGRAAFGQEQG